jgi:hypothetical protein
MKTIWYLVKFFSKEQHADQFIAGQLYLKRLSYFKKVEEACEDGRPDANEAVAFWWQPDEILINLSFGGSGEVEITKNDLAAPVSISFDHHDYLHIFCMTAIYTDGFECIDGKIEYTENEAANLRKQLEIDKRCFKFGKFAVVTPAVPFLGHVKQAPQTQGYGCKGRLVDYYDEQLFHGKFAEQDIPFKKQKAFSYQREFRLCITPKTADDTALVIDIGDIKHISAKTESSLLNTLFKIDSIKVPNEGR